MESLYSFDITKTNEIIFHISEYKDIHYGNIRKFIKSQRYTGATKQGIILTKEQLENVYKHLLSLPSNINNLEDMSQTVVANGESVLKVDVSLFKDSFYVGIRFYIEQEGGYNGPTKKGVSVKYEFLDELISGIKCLLDNIDKEPSNLVEKPDISNVNNLNDSVELPINLPTDYEKYFQ